MAAILAFANPQLWPSHGAVGVHHGFHGIGGFLATLTTDNDADTLVLLNCAVSQLPVVPQGLQTRVFK
jgi:hypothetical protein